MNYNILGIILCTIIAICFIVVVSAYAEPYMKSNTTIANVTAEIDLNEEWQADLAIRYSNPFPEKQLTQFQIDKIINPEAANHTLEDEIRHVACPMNFTEDNMSEYYKCMSGR